MWFYKLILSGLAWTVSLILIRGAVATGTDDKYMRTILTLSSSGCDRRSACGWFSLFWTAWVFLASKACQISSLWWFPLGKKTRDSETGLVTLGSGSSIALDELQQVSPEIVRPVSWKYGWVEQSWLGWVFHHGLMRWGFRQQRRMSHLIWPNYFRAVYKSPVANASKPVSQIVGLCTRVSHPRPNWSHLQRSNIQRQVAVHYKKLSTIEKTWKI